VTGQNVQLSVYDIAGRRVTTLLDSYLSAGEHELDWSGQGSEDEVLSSGVYFLSLKTRGTRERYRVTLLK